MPSGRALSVYNCGTKKQRAAINRNYAVTLHVAESVYQTDRPKVKSPQNFSLVSAFGMKRCFYMADRGKTSKGPITEALMKSALPQFPLDKRGEKE